MSRGLKLHDGLKGRFLQQRPSRQLPMSRGLKLEVLDLQVKVRRHAVKATPDE